MWDPGTKTFLQWCVTQKTEVWDSTEIWRLLTDNNLFKIYNNPGKNNSWHFAVEHKSWSFVSLRVILLPDVVFNQILLIKRLAFGNKKSGIDNPWISHFEIDCVEILSFRLVISITYEPFGKSSQEFVKRRDTTQTAYYTNPTRWKYVQNLTTHCSVSSTNSRLPSLKF